MPTKQKMAPLRLFIPITRSKRTDDGNALLVEGYAYVNAVVGDGWNLTRAAMEAATADYMKWGAVREMHVASAVGTAHEGGTAVVDGDTIPLGIEWDEKGAFCRSLVVDPVAIEKCERGVYKGYSVGVSITEARGTEVLKCTWFENSLVDRPYDKDATLDRLLIARADGIAEDAGDSETEAVIYAEGEEIPSADEPTEPAEPVEPPTVVRGVFADKMKARENPALRGLAFDVLYSSLYKLSNDTSGDNVEAAVREVCSEFADYVAPLVAEAAAQNKALPDEIYYGAGLGDDILKRLQDTTSDAVAERAEKKTALTRVAALEEELRVSRAETATAKGETEAQRALVAERDGRIAELMAEPDPRQPRPVRNGASERDFLAARNGPETLLNGTGAADDGTITALQDEYVQLMETLPSVQDESKREEGVVRIQRIKMELASRGASVRTASSTAS